MQNIDNKFFASYSLFFSAFLNLSDYHNGGF